MCLLQCNYVEYLMFVQQLLENVNAELLAVEGISKAYKHALFKYFLSVAAVSLSSLVTLLLIGIVLTPSQKELLLLLSAVEIAVVIPRLPRCSLQKFIIHPEYVNTKR